MSVFVTGREGVSRVHSVNFYWERRPRHFDVYMGDFLNVIAQIWSGRGDESKEALPLLIGQEGDVTIQSESLVNGNPALQERHNRLVSARLQTRTES